MLCYVFSMPLLFNGATPHKKHCLIFYPNCLLRVKFIIFSHFMWKFSDARFSAAVILRSFKNGATDHTLWKYVLRKHTRSINPFRITDARPICLAVTCRHTKYSQTYLTVHMYTWHYFLQVSLIWISLNNITSNFKALLSQAVLQYQTCILCSYTVPYLYMLTFWRRNYFFNFSTPCI